MTRNLFSAGKTCSPEGQGTTVMPIDVRIDAQGLIRQISR